MRSLAGPFWNAKKVATVAQPLVAFWVRRVAPVLGPCVCFQLKVGGAAKMEPIFALFLFPEATAVWQWFHFLQGQVPPGRPVLREPGRDQRQVLI